MTDTCEVDPFTQPSQNGAVDLKKKKKALRRQILMSIVSVMGPLIAGASYSLASVTKDQITRANNTNHALLTEDQLSLANNTNPVLLTDGQFLNFASFHTITAPLGGLLVILLMDKIGRRATLLVGGVSAAISAVIMALAPEETNMGFYYTLLVSRFFIGITCGIGTAPSGAYIGEISNHKIRGRLILLISLSFASGITLMFILGHYIRNDFRLISWISFGYSLTTIIATALMKESPTWLMSKGREKESRESLNYFRGARRNDEISNGPIENEFEALKQSCQKVKGIKRPPFLKLVKEPEAYKPLLVMTLFFACQQFSGVFVVIVFAVQISKEAEVFLDPTQSSVLIGLARLITTICVSPLIDRRGRRPLVFCSAFGMAICMFALACRFWFPEELSQITAFSDICINGFIVTSTLGLMTLPYVMTAEIFPSKVKGPATGIVLSAGLLMCFINIQLYDRTVNSWGIGNMFAFYGAMSLLSIVCLYMFLPETKGKTLQEIEDYFKYGKNGRPREIEMKEKEYLNI